MYDFPFPKPYKKKTLYVWGEVPFYEVIQGISAKCYFSHYSAMKVHGLTEQVPKVYFINEEQKLGSWLAGKLTQATINAAFKREPRKTARVAQTDDYTVMFLNGKNTNNMGVIESDIKGVDTFGRIRVTNIERTLIDCAVRPVYSGGVHEVLKAFRTAGDGVSANRLAATLKKLEYIYPYHQVIGFYLEAAGFPSSFLDLFSRIPMEFDFYLEHGMKSQRYVKEWRLFVPKWL